MAQLAFFAEIFACLLSVHLNLTDSSIYHHFGLLHTFLISNPHFRVEQSRVAIKTDENSQNEALAMKFSLNIFGIEAQGC